MNCRVPTDQLRSTSATARRRGIVVFGKEGGKKGGKMIVYSLKASYLRIAHAHTQHPMGILGDQTER